MSVILIVDERPAIRAALDVLLSSDNHRVVGRRGPEEGLQTLAVEPVDLVVLQVEYADEEVPGETSLAFARAARTAHPSLPIVALAAHGHPAIPELIAIDGVEHMAVPWNNEHVLRTVRSLLDRPMRMRTEPSKTDIEDALLDSRGVIARAARQLGMSKDALYELMRKLRLTN
jgi:DNA-binding NtrC family response regulator